MSPSVQVVIELSRVPGRMHPFILEVMQRTNPPTILLVGREQDVTPALPLIKDVDEAEGWAWTMVLGFDPTVGHGVYAFKRVHMWIGTPSATKKKVCIVAQHAADLPDLSGLVAHHVDLLHLYS